ncbi:circularly permuted type 2 ATP-grasp protein [Fretibacter rubidus]|uniref:circularly permuted type 2 ATP-grasp protein n=1 Tax=Fretibacter rubidus TaxID=570162 RepID=UPI00352B6984
MDFFDEMLDNGAPRESYASYHAWYESQDKKLLKRKMTEAEAVFRRTGITFNVYGKRDADERLIPFDIIPRIIAAREWARLTLGIEQRVKAINAFLHDIYHNQEILKAGILPSALIENNDAFLPQMIGVTPPGKVYTHIVGVDLVRTGADDFFVLEDNARTPSGVSYMLENRETMLQIFPELFSRNKVQRVNNYPQTLRQSLEACAPKHCTDKPVIAVLTPGIHNSAYFEHAFLADQMGAELVEANDIRIRDKKVCMRTTQGYTPIDVLYRRVDDDYLDPLNFKPESMLGIPGIMDIYRAGGITIANAPGSGIADDKAIYSYMPDIVRFYTGEKALLRNVETWRCSDPDSLKYVLEHLGDLVVKEVHGSGGYGMLVGPASTKAEIDRFAKKLRKNPSNYIAQPTLALSTTPILNKGELAPRHVDLRPFVLVAPDKIITTPGGLTRVAMKKGLLVVNSSQGGGTKDTWVLED